MNYPQHLSPTTFETIQLPDGRSLEVPKATPLFTVWNGPSPGSDYNRKPILTHNGQPAFAELAILWSFLDAGWDGRWIDTYRNRSLRSFWPTPTNEPIPPAPKELLDGLATGNARPWDVYCWKEKEAIFIEAKRKAKDRIQPTQRRFLQNGVNNGLPLNSFLFVEWRAV